MKQKIRFCRSTDGVRIAYATMGSGPPIVWVANWLTHLNLDLENPFFSHWFQALSRDNTLIRFDARGNGLSDRDVDHLSVDAWRSDLEAVVADLGLERFPLFGFCQGGATAIAYAHHHPGKVSQLVLYDSYPRGAYTPGPSLKMKQQAQALEDMIRVGWGKEAPAFREVFVSLLSPEASKERQRWLAEMQRETTSPHMAARLWRAFHEVDVTSIAQEVDVPALVFHVKGDEMVPFEAGRQLASLLPRAQFVPLDGENHILLEEDPAWTVFLEEVRDFLGMREKTWEPEFGEDHLADLTPREREVLTWLARGLTNLEIADELVIAPKTVRNYVSRIYSKLGVESRAQAVLAAQEGGITREG